MKRRNVGAQHFEPMDRLYGNKGIGEQGNRGIIEM
jgi:hypothetical protein